MYRPNPFLKIKQLEKDYAGAMEEIEVIDGRNGDLVSRLVRAKNDLDKANWNLTVAEAEASKATRVSKTATERMWKVDTENEHLLAILRRRNKFDNWFAAGCVAGFVIGFVCAYMAHMIGWH